MRLSLSFLCRTNSPARSDADRSFIITVDIADSPQTCNPRLHFHLLWVYINFIIKYLLRNTHYDTIEILRMIISFGCDETEKIWDGYGSRKFPPDIQSRIIRKLHLIDAAKTLDDLRNPPGNNLEQLHGDRKTQYSIRVNDKWRVCFVFKSGDAELVHVVDYH